MSYYQYVSESLRNKLKGAALATMLFASPLAAKVDPNKLFDEISKHEGVRQVIYRDSMGHKTIGIGFNLDDANNHKILTRLGINFDDLLKGKPLTPVQVKQLYNESLKIAFHDANQFIPNLQTYSDSVQIAVIDMAFNLGINRLSQFQKFKAALLVKNFKRAAQEIQNSNLAPNRKKDLATLVSS